MDFWVRTASPLDDLSVLWPALGAEKLNLEQVIVAVDTNDRVLAGAIMFHAGHSLAYAGEFAVLPDLPNRRAIGRKLIDDVFTFCRNLGAPQIVFNVQDPHFASMAMRLGAQLAGHSMLLTMRVIPYETQHYGG